MGTDILSMGKVVTNTVLVLLLNFCSRYGLAQQAPLLEQSITLEANEQSIANILRLIEGEGKFTFVYSTNHINVSSIKSLKVVQVRIREVLNLLFENKVVYKQRGNHIILQSSPTASKIKIDGYIIDGVTNEKISEASIFDKVRRISAISNKYGYYVLQLEPGKDKLKLFVNKQNYKDTVIYIGYQNNKSVNIEIYPARELQDSTAQVDTTQQAIDTALYSIDNLALVKLLTSELEQVHAQNIKDTMHRRFQISFLPYLGTNMHLNGQVVNDVSINVLGGYNMGVSGTEVGLFMNMNRGDVRNVQLAGFGNINGGYTSGLQAAGFFNFNRRRTTGVQLAGFTNINGDSIRGLSMSGFANYYRQPVSGLIIAGFSNTCYADNNAVALAGFMNISNGNATQWQIAGGINATRKKAIGLQLAGIANINNDTVHGTQISGILNVARRTVGLQIGLINVADSVTKGSFGLLSFVRKGVHQLEFSTNETFAYNAALRTGSHKFYTALYAGLQPYSGAKTIQYYGYGIGYNARLSKKSNLNLDLSSHQLVRNFNFNSYNPYARFDVTYEYFLGKKIALTAGPSMVALGNSLSTWNTIPNYEDVLPSINVYEQTVGDYNFTYWFGAKVGIRFF